MAERGMLFSAPLVRAILDGRKTETRRPMKPQPKFIADLNAVAWDCSAVRSFVFPEREPEIMSALCPLATKGDTIYVRETHAVVWNEADRCRCVPAGSWCPEHMTIEYRADTDAEAPAGWDSEPPENRMLTWTPSIHMQRDRSRIDLLVVEVLAERVRDITWQGARAEGIGTGRVGHRGHAVLVDEFQLLWDQIYSTRLGLAWGENPWVWVVKFEVERIKS